MTANDEVKAWAEWVDNMIDRNWQAWMTTFMFRELHIEEKATIAIMNREVRGFYSKFLTRLNRKPNGINGMLTRPVLLGCPDFPVHKHGKKGGRLNLTNGGAHFGSLFFLPYSALQPSSRLKEPFDQHIERKNQTYCGPSTSIDRIDVTAIDRTPKQATEYVLKSLANHRISFEDVLLLPRSQTEL